MKIAIPSTGETLDAQLDARLGRARCFLLYDTDSGQFEVLDNDQNVNAPQGAGVQAGQKIADSGADAVLTNNCGPKAFRVLTSAGVDVYLGAQGTVAQAIEAFQAGELTLADEANVEGHWM